MENWVKSVSIGVAMAAAYNASRKVQKQDAKITAVEHAMGKNNAPNFPANDRDIILEICKTSKNTSDLVTAQTFFEMLFGGAAYANLIKWVDLSEEALVNGLSQDVLHFESLIIRNVVAVSKCGTKIEFHEVLKLVFSGFFIITEVYHYRVLFPD